MCGFTGILTFNATPCAAEIIPNMTSVLSHRGPDDHGTYYAGRVGLGFRRLSILDLSPAGHQPMSSSDGAATIVFNGEIYNYIELREELRALGHRFRSSGDTEVLLHAYLEWGPQCLLRLNGMWAFVVHDQRSGKLFGSRDRFGIKPLYLYRNEDCLLFASEIKAIRASGLYRHETNWSVAAAFLLEGQLDETAETFYQGIQQLPPGAAFEVDARGAYREWRYWALPQPGNKPPDSPADAFADLFEDSVRVHMRSDVPVGVNLSGGLDSTSIICASARTRAAARATGDLLAFCYMTPEFDEVRYIDDTLDQTQASLIRLETTPHRLWSDLERVLWFQDEPVHSMTAVVGYQLMHLAAQHGIKVILNGQGADETIGGYPSYFRDYWHTLLIHGEIAHYGQEITRHAQAHGGKRSKILTNELRHLLLGLLSHSSIYRRFTSQLRRTRALHSAWFTPDLAKHLPERERVWGRDLDSVLARAVGVAPLPLYLRVEDRNSMAHSIEVRLPFLDYRLVEILFSLPPNWKLRGPWNKYVLREGMRKRIPESVRTRLDKMGFPVPARTWFANALYEPLRDLLGSRSVRERGIYRQDAIVGALDRHRKGEADMSTLIFSIAQFELWSSLSRT